MPLKPLSFVLCFFYSSNQNLFFIREKIKKRKERKKEKGNERIKLEIEFYRLLRTRLQVAVELSD